MKPPPMDFSGYEVWCNVCDTFTVQELRKTRFGADPGGWDMCCKDCHYVTMTCREVPK